MKEEVKKLIEKVSKDTELKNKFLKSKDVNELLSVAKDAGYSITEDDLKSVGQNFKEGSGISELSSKELEKVSGGGGCGCAGFGFGHGSNNIGDFGCQCMGPGAGGYSDYEHKGKGLCVCAIAGAGATNEKGC